MHNFDRKFELVGAESARFAGSPLPELLRFGAEGPPREAIAALQAHPRFPEAAWLTAVGSVRLYRGNRLLNLMINDRGRFMISLFAVHLHRLARPNDPNSGLTVSRMAAMCSEQRLCSQGRANAMLMLMRAFGYLASAPAHADRRVRRLVPTETLMSLHRERIRILLDGCAIVMPDHASTFSVQSHPSFTPVYLSHLCQLYLSGFRNQRCVPDARLFIERNAGLIILNAILGSSDPEDSFPPAHIVSVRISALSRRFGVSRAHVRRLLQDAVSEGYLEKADENNSFRTLPRLVQMMNDFTALAFLVVGRCAHLAAAELDRERVAA
jgi:hypothetical protein